MAGPDCVLITGASGFVGRHLVAALRARFPASRLLACSREGVVEGADAIVPLDLEDRDGMARLLLEAAPDAVVHLAAQAAVGASFRDPMATWRVNVDGTLALAEIIRTRLPRTLLVHASSAEIYGLSFRSGLALDETAALQPANPYAASKAAVDVALGEMALRGLRLVRLRPFSQVGPGQGPDFMTAAFARQIARIEQGLQLPVMQVGALERWRDFMDVRDMCAAYAAVLEQAETLPPGVAINVASGTSRRVGDVLQALLQRSRMTITVEPAAHLQRPTDVERVCGDAGLARRLLDWTPVRRWDDTLDELLADWRARVGG